MSATRSLLTLVVLAMLAGCKVSRMGQATDTTAPAAPAPSVGATAAVPAPTPTEDPQIRAGEQEELQRLEREARALAKTAGCDRSGDCRTAPVGSRPCGGPRDYVVYCARTTDSVALFRKLDELARKEQDYNKRAGLMSTCEFRAPPAVTASGGSCRAVSP